MISKTMILGVRLKKKNRLLGSRIVIEERRRRRSELYCMYYTYFLECPYDHISFE